MHDCLFSASLLLSAGPGHPSKCLDGGSQCQGWVGLLTAFTIVEQYYKPRLFIAFDTDYPISILEWCIEPMRNILESTSIGLLVFRVMRWNSTISH